MVVYTYNPSTLRLRQEDCEFEPGLHSETHGLMGKSRHLGDMHSCRILLGLKKCYPKVWHLLSTQLEKQLLMLFLPRSSGRGFL
jgi:hypothetical protein